MCFFLIEKCHQLPWPPCLLRRPEPPSLLPLPSCQSKSPGCLACLPLRPPLTSPGSPAPQLSSHPSRPSLQELWPRVGSLSPSSAASPGPAFFRGLAAERLHLPKLSLPVLRSFRVPARLSSSSGCLVLLTFLFSSAPPSVNHSVWWRGPVPRS